MGFEQSQIEELKSYYPGIGVVTEGGTDFILVPALCLPDGCAPAVVDALLCPTPRDNYSSRLFLSQKPTHRGPGQNFNANGVMIAGRQWWAASWNTNRTDLTLLQTMLAHLDAFRCKQS
jgi:hypothetical protein